MVPQKKRKQPVTSSKAKAEPTPEAKQRRLQGLLKEVQQFGVKPPSPAKLFVVHGASAYVLDEAQLVSLRALPTRQGAYPAEMEQDKQLAAHNRSLAGRKRLTINAGTPRADHPRAGWEFQTHAFSPTDSELHEKCWAEPKPLNFELSPHPYCSSADVLARYAGGKALLSPDGASFFMIFFLNSNESRFEARPEEGDDPSVNAKYETQRARFEGNLRKLFLVYPYRVEPVLVANGARQPRLGYALPPIDAHECAFGVGCFAGILSDKREGKPGASSQCSIGGYHERCRLWLLSPKILEKIVQAMDHFGLDIPALRNPLAGKLRLDECRAEALEQLGPPPASLTAELGLDPAWLSKRALLPFAKPWVQRCNFHHPNGEVGEDGAPVLVPLYKGCAEERNGHCWLDPDAFPHASPHGQRIQEILCKLVGRTYKPPAAHTEAVVRELEKSLSETRSSLEHTTAQLKQTTRTLEATRQECDALRARLTAKERALNLVQVDDIAPGTQVAGKLVLGGVDARVSIRREMPGAIQLQTPGGDCLASWPHDSEHGDRLLLRFQAELDEEEDE